MAKVNNRKIISDIFVTNFYKDFGNGRYFHPWMYYPEFSELTALTRWATENDKGTGSTLLTHSKLYNLIKSAKTCLNVDGSFWECGVYEGGSASVLAGVLAEENRSLYLFDTFEGIPVSEPENQDSHPVGAYSTSSIPRLKSMFETKYPDVYERVSFIQGSIPDTFESFENEQIAFAHIDVDQYSSVKSCLEFIWPRISVGGMVVLDDYGDKDCRGALSATEEFCNINDLHVIYCLEGQGILIKNN
tara:strand:+ start:2420 stop:3157 length:738 start_codon:yes stop_codon:yes gene_type:complete